MKLSPLLFAISLFAAQSVAYPSTSLATRSPDGNEEKLVRRVDGRDCAGRTSPY